MTFPGGITLVRVWEDYFNQSGSDDPLEAIGAVTFTAGTKAEPIYLNLPDGGIFLPGPIPGNLAADTGLMSVDLIPSDTPNLDPQDFTYHLAENVKVTIGGQEIPFTREYDIQVTLADAVLNETTGVLEIRLSDIAPTTPSSGSVTYVRSVNGIDPDADGDLALTAAEVGAYTKPVGGIPETDLDSATRAKIDAAGSSGTVTAVNGVSPDGLGHVTLTASDVSAASAAALSSEITRAEATEAGKYVLPAGGIPKTDMATTVQTSLANADTAVQPARQVIAGTGLAGGGTLAADRTLSVVYGATAGTAAQGNDTRITGAEQTANKNAAGGYVGIDATTGRALPLKLPLVPQIVDLTFAATLAIDASAGSLFRVTLTGNITLSAPTNPSDGQTMLIQWQQDATGGHSVTLDATAFNLGPLTATASAAPNAVDYLLAKYRAAASKWDVLAFGAGY